MSALDVFVVCDKIIPYATRMVVDEKREHVLTNYSAVKRVGRIVESDHNPVFLYLNLQFSRIRNERVEIFQFRNKESQQLFKTLTTNTSEFTDCFKNYLSFEQQSTKWRQVLDNYFHKAFKKVRITNKPSKKNSEINSLMEKRRNLKKKEPFEEQDEVKLKELEETIAGKCEDQNRRKVSDNFKGMDGNEGNLNHQGIWKIKKKYFPRKNPSLPAGKKNLKKQLITNPAELKELYLQTFKYRLRHRPAQPGFESLLDDQEELFKLRLELSKENVTPEWSMSDLEEALNALKAGKCRDPEGIIREVFKEESLGDDLKLSLLILFNKIKKTRIFPAFMQNINICAIYKGKGDVNDLESDRGIFLVTIFRTILMKMVYKDKYPIIENSMSDSNIGARKKMNIRNHIFVVNSILHDVLSKKSNKSIDIMVLDYKQMFDSECLFECMNDLFEAGVKDDIFALIHESNRINQVAVQTPHGLSRREAFEEIVMQGDVLAPLISSLQVDTIGKECLQEKKHLYFYKDIVPIPPLGMVDDLFTISECGVKTSLLNQFINVKSATKKLQFGTTKCIKMHVGKAENYALCKDLHVGGWRIDVVDDEVTGTPKNKEYFSGEEKMELKKEQTYLGDLICADGTHTKKVQQRSNKGLGIINEIMNILEATYFGKFYFEVALILRESLFLSALLLNSEAWVNYKEKDVRILEQCDEMLLTRILECDGRSSNPLKYLELGAVPIRFQIMRRKLAFLHYLLNQDKDSMIYNVLKATGENPVKNDFVLTCEKYLETLEINLSFEEIAKLSKFKFNKLLKGKIEKAAFTYLKKQQSKQEKIKEIFYSTLETQEYLINGDRNPKVAKVIYQARGHILDIKMQKKWKFVDKLCSGCNLKEESGDEILNCKFFGGNAENLTYSMFYSDKLSEQLCVGKKMMEKLEIIKKIREEVT